MFDIRLFGIRHVVALLVAVSCLAFLGGDAVAVDASSAAAQAPAKRPERPKRRPQRQEAKLPSQSKRIGQSLIEPIIDGKHEQAAERCEQILAVEPDYLEALYSLAIAQAQLGRQDEAVATMQRAIEAGLPPERFLVGPRRLMQPLAGTEAFKRLAAAHSGRLLHGPMVGCVTDRSAKFWVRTLDEAPVQVVASTDADLRAPLKSATVFTESRRDFTAVAELTGLQPGTRYYYDVLVKGRRQLGPEPPSFRTHPTEQRAAEFSVGFGGGAGYTLEHERMWDTIAGHHLAAFLFLGDNVYIDNPTRPAMQLYTYYRRQSRPEYRRFVSTTPIYAIWDDHDFGVNDCFYGDAIDQPPWKIPVWRVFRDNWNNPAYGGGREQPGCWFRFSIADVDFFMLDGRYYRTDPRKPDPTMLGAAQKQWLLDGLRRSEGTFRVLASPVPWVLEAKGKSLDTWRGFQAEREEIFSFLEREEIGGVILISADRHRSDVWRIDRPGSYPLYEFESSRLTNVHRHGAMPGALFSYNAKCSFGKLTFDTTADDPTVTYDIVNIDNERIHTHVVKLSEISPP